MTPAKESFDTPGAISGEFAAPKVPGTSLTKYWLWIVLLLVCWQPLELGFYMDDWAFQAESAKNGAAFSKQLFNANLALDTSRPGLAVIRFVVSSVLGDQPLLWQIAMLLANGLIAVWLARAAQAIVGMDWRVSNRAALSVGLLWLLLPWSTSSQFWTGVLPQELVVALFAYLITRIAGRQSPALVNSIIDGLIYLWICVSYEAFYGQFVAVVLLCVALAVVGRMRGKTAIINLLSLGIAQLAAVGWYFTSAKVTAAQRGIDPGWIGRMLQNLEGIVPQMATSALEMRWMLFVSFLGLLTCAAWILWRARPLWATTKGILGSALIALACGLGALVSVVSFSLGDRPLHALGVENRFFVLLSFWLVLLIAVTALAVLRVAERRERNILGWLALACGAILGVAHTVRALEWASAWTQQQEILRNAPVEQMQAMETDAAVLMVNPLTVNGAPIFAAPWDINHALPLRYRTLASRTVIIYSPWVGPMVWDGYRLTYMGLPPLATTHHIYVWVPLDRSFRRADRPFQVGQNLTVSDLP